MSPRRNNEKTLGKWYLMENDFLSTPGRIHTNNTENKVGKELFSEREVLLRKK